MGRSFSGPRPPTPPPPSDVEGGKCDSCSRIVDILIPIRILAEVAGRMEMQLRHYCPECFDEITSEWEYGREDEERNEPPLRFTHDEKRDIWHFKVRHRMKVTGANLRELFVHIMQTNMEGWVIAWFESGEKEGRTNYQIHDSERAVKELYKKLLQKENVEEVVMGKVTRRDLLVDKEK